MTVSLYLTPPLIEVPVPIQESERTCIVCAKGIDFVPVSVIFRMYFETFLTVC
jgi:hypothetical protein